MFTEVTPAYGNGLEKVMEKASGEEYYLETLNGPFTFLRADYDLIAGTSIEDTINFNMEKWDGSVWQTYFSGYFTKADCKFEVDECGEGICRVDITPRDFYDAILGGMDKEFDLIELEPEKTGFNFTRQPIFQVYALGDSVMTCYLGGTYFELEVPVPQNGSALVLDYFFGFIGVHAVVFSGETLSPDVSGEYVDETGGSFGSTLIRKGDNAYRIAYNAGTTQWEIRDATSGSAYYLGVAGELPAETTFTSPLDASTCYARIRSLWMRLITNQISIGGGPTYDIPETDIVVNPAGYNKVLGVGRLPTDNIAGTPFENVTIAHAGHSPTPTRYGKFSDDAPFFAGEYFTIPAGAGSGAIYPQGQSTWPDASFWFQYDSVLRDFQESGAELIQVADAYKLADALDAVLQELNPGVSHSESAAFSDFLYGPANAIRGAVKYPIITPKTNITVGEYDQPAKKGPIRLSDILQYLWAAYRCKWHIDASGNFIVEHISYYENGGTYSGTEVSADLTTLTDPQTGKNWEHGANRWEYEKEEMPDRLEPGWMDRATREFDGYPIVIRSVFVQKGNIEQQKAARFTSDIDYMQLQPEDIGKDGFAVVECTESKGVYTVPYVEITLPDGAEFKLQNGYLAFIYLHPAYCRYGLPAALIRMNEEDTTALSVTRRKIQEVDYPLLGIVEPMKLVTTGLGTGKILELRENVAGEYLTAKIAHDTT